jgi:hypothetical protein
MLYALKYISFKVRFTSQKPGPEGIQGIQNNGTEMIKTYEGVAESNNLMFI